MIVLAGALLGIVLGGAIAWRRKGRRWDILHYGAVYGLGFTLVGLFITLFIHRALVM